ncbi:MAG: TfoX/Sxy family protein [Candidatus Algichlamydia australiensis]|nr:TfoX/Sxy family protein [Chlamydiales bacterium]
MGKWKKSSEELKEKFLSTMAAFAEAEPRKMFGYPCCFLHGNMFTGLHEENWVLRLQDEDREAMIAEHNAERFAPMGRLMKEYVILPKGVLTDETALTSWIQKSISYVMTLPVKIQKKKANAKA